MHLFTFTLPTSSTLLCIHKHLLSLNIYLPAPLPHHLYHLISIWPFLSKNSTELLLYIYYCCYIYIYPLHVLVRSEHNILNWWFVDCKQVRLSKFDIYSTKYEVCSADSKFKSNFYLDYWEYILSSKKWKKRVESEINHGQVLYINVTRV